MGEISKLGYLVGLLTHAMGPDLLYLLWANPACLLPRFPCVAFIRDVNKQYTVFWGFSSDVVLISEFVLVLCFEGYIYRACSPPNSS